MAGEEHPFEFLSRLLDASHEGNAAKRAAYHEYFRYCGYLAMKEQDTYPEYSQKWWSNLFAGHFYGVESSKLRLRAELDKLDRPEKAPEPPDSATLGHCYLMGIGRGQNVPQAVKIYEYRSPELLAMCYWDGIEREESSTKALKLLQDSKKPWAKLQYALCLLQTSMDEKNLKIALDIFTESANSGNPFGAFWVGMFHSYEIAGANDKVLAKDSLAYAKKNKITADKIGEPLRNIILDMIDIYCENCEDDEDWNIGDLEWGEPDSHLK